MSQAHVSARSASRAPTWLDPLLFALLVASALGGIVAYHGGLDFPIVRDEIWFWEKTTRWFLERWPPDLVDLRNYPEPMTPLSFLLWASVDRISGAGIASARATNLVLATGLLALVGLRVRPPTRPALLCALGLLLFPYTVPLSLYVYTDIPAAFLVVLGFWLHAHRRPGLAALAFALGIATRQYVVAFPAALLAAELAPAVFRRGPGGRWRPSFAAADWKPGRTVPLALSVATLAGWFAFFGGFGPQPGIELWPRHSVGIGDLEPGFALYFLTCLGLYFVAFEFVLFRRRTLLRDLSRPLALGALAVVLLLFAVFSPIDPEHEMGVFNRTMATLLPPAVLGGWSEAVRIVLYSVLAWAACVRFARCFGAGDLVFWVVVANGALMLASFEAWEKYNLATIAVLWYLRSLCPLERPVDPWRARDPEPAAGPGRSRIDGGPGLR